MGGGAGGPVGVAGAVTVRSASAAAGRVGTDDRASRADAGGGRRNLCINPRYGAVRDCGIVQQRGYAPGRCAGGRRDLLDLRSVHRGRRAVARRVAGGAGTHRPGPQVAGGTGQAGRCHRFPGPGTSSTGTGYRCRDVGGDPRALSQGCHYRRADSGVGTTSGTGFCTCTCTCSGTGTGTGTGT